MIKQNELKVGAILVNWRQAEKTVEAVKSIVRQTIKAKIIVVVDNGSNDNSVEVIKKGTEWANMVKIIPRTANSGFGTGCNEGIKMAMSEGCDYVWLLNNDAQAKDDCLEKMVEKINKNENIGAVGARIFETFSENSGHAACSMNPFTLGCVEIKEENDLNINMYTWITGASILIRMKVLNHVGAFDQNYFMYWEDADLCHRIRKFGYKLAIARDAIVYHKAGTSSSKLITERYKWHLESQLRWIDKHYNHKKYGKFIVYARHVIKSITSFNIERLNMIIGKIIRN